MGITYSGGTTSPVKREVYLDVAINGTLGETASQDFRRSSGVPTNISPFAVKFDAEITQVVLSTISSNIWGCQVLVNDVVVGTYGRLNSQPTQIFNLGGTASIPVSESDQIRIRFASGVGSTTAPAVGLTYREV